MLPRPYRLGSDKNFQRVYKQRKRVGNEQLVVNFARNASAQNRFGFVVSKKRGNAPTRHKITRLLRAAIVLQKEKFSPGFDVIVQYKSQKMLSFVQIQEALTEVFQKAGILNH